MKGIRLILIAILLMVSLIAAYGKNSSSQPNFGISFCDSLDFNSCKSYSQADWMYMCSPRMEKSQCADSAQMKTCGKTMGLDFKGCMNLSQEECKRICKAMIENGCCPDSINAKRCNSGEKLIK